jgi:hypothetical protein
MVVFAVAVVFLIGFSRVQLGVHFPTDVLAGWLLGGILAKAYLRWSDPAIDWARRLSFERQMLLALGVPLVLTALHGPGTPRWLWAPLARSQALSARRQRLSDEAAPKRHERLLVGLVGLPILYLAPSSSPSRHPVLLSVSVDAFATIGLWIGYLVRSWSVP